jgi:hypothetical protein
LKQKTIVQTDNAKKQDKHAVASIRNGYITVKGVKTQTYDNQIMNKNIINVKNNILWQKFNVTGKEKNEVYTY